MDNLMDKVQELLSDPESLKQIQELADILNSDSNNSQPQEDQTNSTNNNFNNQDTNFQNNETNKNQEGQQDDVSNGFDIGMIFQLMQLFNTSSNSQDATLLLAIKPYLSEERQSKVDKAIKLMKAYDIFTIAKDSGLLNNLDSLI